MEHDHYRHNFVIPHLFIHQEIFSNRFGKFDPHDQAMPENENEPICPLCKRPLGSDHNKHHLIPKTFKGKETIDIHRICHDKIHTVFTERELKQHYHTIEKLLENEEMQKFVKWLQNKHPDFYERNKDSGTRKKTRKKR